jgi:hypothetical protein
MINRSSNDRIILFTLVDLLIQIIFFGFFLFAINRAREGDLRPKLDALISKVGIRQLATLVEATSKLVSIADLSHIDVVGSGPSIEAVTNLNDLIDLIKRLDRESLRKLKSSNLSVQQLADVSGLFRRLTPLRQKTLVDLLGKFSNNESKLIEVLAAYGNLSKEDLAKLVIVARAYARGNREIRAKISSAAVVIKTTPPCFPDKQALDVVSIAGGFLVRVLPTDGSRVITGELGHFRVADAVTVAKNGLNGQYYDVPGSAFAGFGSTVNAHFSNCYITAKEASKTDMESQFKMIQRYFYTSSP